MRGVLGFTVAAIVTLAAAWYLAGLPGQVTIALAGYSISFASSVAVVALAVLVGTLYALLRLLSWIVRTPTRLGAWRRRRRRTGGEDAITRTLVAIAAGVEDDARREAARARRLLGDTPQTLLLAAEAGRLGNRETEAAELYAKLAQREDAALLGLRGLFRQAINREAWAEAAAIAARAEQAHPGGPWLREERAQLAVRTGDWSQALRLSGRGAPREAYATAAANAEPDVEAASRQARKAWKDNPGFTPAALAYASRLRAAGNEVKALQTIREAWTAAPHPDLAAFSLERIADPAAKMREASRIVAGRIDHAESQFLLARLSLDTGELRDVRHHLERARQAGLNQRRVWLLLAELEQREHGDSEEGRAAQRDALRQAALADADPAWRCDQCGTEHQQWHPACPTCHTAGRIRWGVRQTALLATAV